MSEWDEDLGEEGTYVNRDVCPGCATLLTSPNDINENCHDPSGCGGLREGGWEDEDYEEEEIEELNFD